MTSGQIRFEDGTGYERYMGKWSQLVGVSFLRWLDAPPGLRWLDVGCGNGAFTALIAEHCAPRSIDGIDPSDAQLQFARTRFAGRPAAFHQGDAMNLPFGDAVFDVAVMPLVIFFIPDPARGVAEMARVVGPGGTAAAYAWDMEGGGFPYQVLQDEMRAIGIPVPLPPSRDASRVEVMQGLWAKAGLKEVDTTAITVQRTFEAFDDYWNTVLKGPSVGGQLRAMEAHAITELQTRLRKRLPADAGGRITCAATANAVKGHVMA
jgi:ubiquinone/menaquinone biosynthesis C-methylase UbiE